MKTSSNLYRLCFLYGGIINPLGSPITRYDILVNSILGMLIILFLILMFSIFIFTLILHPIIFFLIQFQYDYILEISIDLFLIVAVDSLILIIIFFNLFKKLLKYFLSKEVKIEYDKYS